jgi:hypothetical protein
VLDKAVQENAGLFPVCFQHHLRDLHWKLHDRLVNQVRVSAILHQEFKDAIHLLRTHTGLRGKFGNQLGKLLRGRQRRNHASYREPRLLEFRDGLVALVWISVGAFVDDQCYAGIEGRRVGDW